MVVTWPTALVPRRCDPELRNFVKSGGRTNTGREQRVFSDAGFWEVTLADFPVNRPDQARAWRALVARLRQGEEVDIKVWDNNAPRGAQSEDATATASGAQAARATAMTISVAGMEIDDGAYFSIGTRLHLVTEAVTGGPTEEFFNPVSMDGPWDDDLPWNDADPNARSVAIKFLPPLREAVASGAIVRFDDLTMRGVLADPSDGDLALDVGRYGTASITIREN